MKSAGTKVSEGLCGSSGHHTGRSHLNADVLRTATNVQLSLSASTFPDSLSLSLSTGFESSQIVRGTGLLLTSGSFLLLTWDSLPIAGLTEQQLHATCINGASMQTTNAVPSPVGFLQLPSKDLRSLSTPVLNTIATSSA